MAIFDVSGRALHKDQALATGLARAFFAKTVKMAKTEKVTGTFPCCAFKGTQNRAMKTRGNGHNRVVLASGHDVYEVRPRKCKDGVDLVSDWFRAGAIWYAGPDAVRNAIAYAKYCSFSRSHRATIRVFDDSGALTQMLIGHENLKRFLS